MKKPPILLICLILGSAAGNLLAHPLAYAIAQSHNPQMFWYSILARYETSVLCGCEDLHPGDETKTLAKYLSSIQQGRASSPNSKLLAQEAGLTYVRLALSERKLNQEAQATDDMKRGQAELAGLGWKDTSEPHLTALVIQLNSEYAPFTPNEKIHAAAGPQ